jgi:hypothetical protein
MKLPKIRLTFGNVLAALTIALGLIQEIAPDVIAISPAMGAKLLSIGAIIGLVTKGMASFNHDLIPDNKKLHLGPVVVERTGPLNPSL